MKNNDRLLKGLNERQIEAVTATEGYVRVIAGAGSGKTKALTARYAYIVESLGISASNILCVTVTNKAAQEMRNRVKILLGTTTDLALITTYHGFCVKVLREDIHKLQYPRHFIIMDVEDQKTILREIFKELGLSRSDFTFDFVLNRITKEKAGLGYMDYILNPRKVESKTPLDKIFSSYLAKQQRNYALDFDDLINFALFLFTSFPETLTKWQSKLHYIQVDETQDSSEKQFTLIEMLSRINQNLFVVGDPDQTIYEWRGARPEILVDFDQQFDGTKTIIMNQNYRSTPNILNLGNEVIKSNRIRVAKDMFTRNPAGVDVVHFHGKDENEEGLWVASEIMRLKTEAKARYSDCVILYRANHISRRIEQSLIRQDIPYTVYGGVRFFERREIKDILAYLRLIEFGDDFSFLRIINTPARGLGRMFVQKLTSLAETKGMFLYDALKDNYKRKDFQREGAIQFISLIEEFRRKKDKMNLSDLVKNVLDESGLSTYYRADGDEDRLKNIIELQSAIMYREREDEEGLSLLEYLQEVALYTDMDIDRSSEDRVKLMTIHAAKGLEFPNVFLCGFTEGVLPSARSLRERRPNALEEERRIAYVAITRAERALHITESEGYDHIAGQRKYPSRFLFEISDKFYIRKGELSQDLVDEAKVLFSGKDSTEASQPVLSVDDHVFHPVFREGQIMEVDFQRKVYMVKFKKTSSTKPINFGFQRLVKLK